jgi:riboflavin synthase
MDQTVPHCCQSGKTLEKFPFKMFTGIVESMGTIKSIQALDESESGGGGFSMVIGNAHSVLTDCNLGDSIACNGICLTVTSFDKDEGCFKVGISPETLRKTNIGMAKQGDRINLERAMSGASRFGGHMVQGHIDTTVQIVSITKDPPNSLIFKFHVSKPSSKQDSDYLSYIVPKGYVALEGASLTVIDVDWTTREFSVMLIAYTQERITLASKSPGDYVNLEVDNVGKYVESLVKGLMASESGPFSTLVDSAVQRALKK